MRKKTIPIFVPHLGCPNACSFCNQKSITGQHHSEVTADEVRKTAERCLSTIDREKTEVEIGFFGGSFTGIDARLQEELLSVAKRLKQEKKIDRIRLSTRPDYVDDEKIARLLFYGVDTVELGVQSMNDAVLSKNLRGHTAEDTIRASRLIKENGMKLGHQVMPGLYGDTEEIFSDTVQKSIALSPDCVRIYPTLVIKDTKLAEWYSKGQYTPLSLEDAVRWSKNAVMNYREKGILVIRVGLLASETVSEDADVLSGPYHPAFGELVESAIVYDKLIKELGGNRTGKIQIAVHPRFVSTLVGERRSNIKRLEETLFPAKITLVQDEKINFGEWRILCI